jgi:hypothetical protein
MKRLLTIIGSALVLVSIPHPTGAQDTREAQGTVSAVTPTSISIKVKDQVMTFNVDEKTQVTARGASTQTRAAQAEGRKGPDLPSLVKVGEGVEIRYHEQGMHAASIRVLPGPVEGSISEKQETETAPKRTLNGTVSALTGTSLTVKTKDGDVTFAIDQKTQVIGKGLGTAGRKKTEAGEKPVLADFVAVGDDVRVVYHEMGDVKHASEVNVTRKGTIVK